MSKVSWVNDWQLLKNAICFGQSVVPFQYLRILYSVSVLWVLSVIFRSTVSWPVCLGIKHSSGAYDQIFIIVRKLRVCWYWALSLTRGRVCRLQSLLALASAVTLGSESRGTRYHILLSQIRDFLLRRLLRLAGLLWRYSTPPPHGIGNKTESESDLYYDQRSVGQTVLE
jgi:hypothetical protein